MTFHQAIAGRFFIQTQDGSWQEFGLVLEMKTPETREEMENRAILEIVNSLMLDELHNFSIEGSGTWFIPRHVSTHRPPIAPRNPQKPRIRGHQWKMRKPKFHRKFRLGKRNI